MAVITIVNGSVYGAAEELAQKLVDICLEHGHQILWSKPAKISHLNEADAVLVVSSTTGKGNIPPKLLPFYAEAKDTLPLISGKPFGVIGLGDSSYEHFCGAADKMQELMFELQGKELVPLLKIDAIETLQPDSRAIPWLEKWLAALP